MAKAWFVVRQRVDDNTEHNLHTLAILAAELRELAESRLKIEVVVDYTDRSPYG